MPKLKLGYDNADDAQAKLVNTFCLYKGRAISIKKLFATETADLSAKYLIHGTHLTTRSNVESIAIDDPEFNCSEYNIGYVNQNGMAAWFFRTPGKQYQQGLKYTQVGAKGTNPLYASIEFKHCKPVGMMLENDYPSLKKVAEMLQSGDAAIMAFNKDFAMSRDKIHGDFILEYKGMQIGYTPNLKSFQLMEGHLHLSQALQEAVG